MIDQHPTTTQAQGDRRLGWALWATTIGALALATAGVLLPRTWGTAVATLAVGVVVAAPLLRLLWLVARWVRERDLRFALAAVGLLGVIGVGVLLAALRQ